MKKLFISALVIFGFTVSAFSQTSTQKIPVDTVTKKITYVGVVQQAGSKDTLYNRASHWGGLYFKNFQGVAKVLDKANGKIEGKYSFKVYNTPTKDGVKTEACVVNFSFAIECKENRYRYKVTDFYLQTPSKFLLERWLDKKDPAYIPEWENYLTQVDQYMAEFIKSLKKGMSEAVKVNDNNW